MKPGSLGILLTNLGTPSAATPRALRRYLRQFLSDRRVIEIPRLVWLPILYGLVLPFRSTRSAKLYQKIWLPEGSPLLIYSQRLQIALQDFLDKTAATKITVSLGMRYGEPSIEQGLMALQAKKVDKILVLPLYPQYAAATTAATFDAVTETLSRWRVVPEVHFINRYAYASQYSAAIATSIKDYWKQHTPAEHLLFSFHGLPQRCSTLGDPYEQDCHYTAQRIAQNLNLPAEKFSVAFQSRFGKAKWLQPYCEQKLRELAYSGIKRIDVICPGFAVDCLETLEEIAQEGRKIFLQAGGVVFNYIPALNDSALQVQMLGKLIHDDISKPF